jgi:anti-sigma-K factor RskA
MSERNDRMDFEARAAALLQQSARTLDGRTRSRLNQARQAALDELPAPRARGWRSGFAIASAAAVAILAVGVWRNLPQTEAPADDLAPAIASVPVGSDLELLLAEENLDMIEDLEFFAWLAAEELVESDGTAG